MNNDLTRIIGLSGIDPKDYPPAVVDAQAFQAEALALVDKLKAIPPVDLESAATPKDVTKVHAAAVAYEREHEIALRHAETLALIAARRVDDAWRASLSGVAVTLGQKFDTAADNLHAALAPYPTLPAATTAAGEHWNPATADLREALATLNALHECRNILARIWVVQGFTVSSTYESDSRTLWFENLAAQARFHARSANKSRDDFYLIAAFTAGVRIEWQTPSQQQEQPAAVAVAKSSAGLATAIRARA